MRNASRLLAWCVALISLSGCAQMLERLGMGGPPAPMPGAAPTDAAFLGIDRVLRAPGEPDGRFERVSFPDSLGSRRILPGDSALVLDLEGPGVVRRIRLTLASGDPHHLRRIVVRMYWNDEVDPSVEVPLGDFFGNAFDKRPYSAVPMGVSSGGFYSYLALPFSRHARIAIVNETGLPIEGIAFDADVDLGVTLTEPVATFHAQWRRDARPRADQPHVVADLSGTGWFVGTSLSAQGYDSTLAFLNGQERMRVDGRRVRTATAADYLNDSGSAAGGALAAAFHGVVLRDDLRGRIAAYRWHLPDPIPFRSSLRLQLERGTANREAADYATVAYWYQVEPHAPFTTLPSSAERRVPDVLFPSGALYRNDLEIFGTGRGTLSLTVPVPRPDRYELVVYPEASPGAPTPTVRVREAGHPTRALEVSPPGAEAGEVLPGVVLDTVAATGRTVELELAAVGGLALPAAVDLRPLPTWATEWWVIGPWPSAEPSGASPTPALDSVWAPELDSDYLQSYRGPGSNLMRWDSADADARGTLDLLSRFSTGGPALPGAAGYAQAFVRSPDNRLATLLVTTEGPFQIWVNGRPAAGRPGPNVSTSEEAEVRVQLGSGWNQVLLKVPDTGEGWALRVRAADPAGDLRWGLNPQGF